MTRTIYNIDDKNSWCPQQRNAGKPRLLFLRFSRPDLPAFIRLHLQEQVMCLSQFFDVTVIEQPRDYRQLCDKYEPDIAIFESGSYVGNRDIKNVSAHPKIPKLGFIHCDAYCPSRELAICDMARWGITTFFGISVSMASYTPELADNLFVWPNFADLNLYHDYGLPKVIPVLFTGSQAIHYPWRNRINKIISQHYPSLQCPHFGWDSENETSRMLSGKTYARLINAAWIAPTCGTIANDVVRKHFEIPACNTLLLTQRTPALEAAGFSDLVNCVFADDVDVLGKLDWLFQKPDELDRITQTGREFVQQHHTIRHRDQVFQWYNLYKQLKPKQRIVQLGPFLPLTIVEQNSQIKNGYVMSAGIDRVLMAQGDEKLWSGHYDEAEIVYKKCLNYHDIPEAKLRLAICCLYKGNSERAIDILGHQIQMVLGNCKGAEPDAIEWAYFVIALLCAGKLREAILRVNQFSSLRHEELDRVRLTIRLLNNQAYEGVSEQCDSSYRPSVHQLPKLIIDDWFAGLCKMLTACRQTEAAERLARSAQILKEVEKFERSNDYSPKVLDSLSYEVKCNDGGHIKRELAAQQNIGPIKILNHRTRARRWLSQHVKHIILQSLWMVEPWVGQFLFLPYKWSSMSAMEDSLTIRCLLCSENIRSGLLIGATSGEWLTEAFLAGMDENPNLPFAVCMNYSTPRFMKLQKRLATKAQTQCRHIPEEKGRFIENNEEFDVAVIDCSQLGDDFAGHKILDIGLIILNDISATSGYYLCQTLLAERNYFLLAHEPSQRGGYAIFRRIIAI